MLKGTNIKYVNDNKNKTINFGAFKLQLFNTDVVYNTQNPNSILTLATVYGKTIYFAGDDARI